MSLPWEQQVLRLPPSVPPGSRDARMSPPQALWAAVLAATPAVTPIAVVLIHGGAVAVPQASTTPSLPPCLPASLPALALAPAPPPRAQVKSSRAAILDAFYPGSVGGPAMADALFGRYNPGGKLPYTVYDAGYADVRAR